MIDEKQVGLARLSRVAYGDHDLLRAGIREAIHASGVAAVDDPAPLAAIVPRDASVLLKPNWVLDVNQSGATMDCMVTHPQFILAAMAEVLQARPSRIVIADAPIQGASFHHLAPPEWRARVKELAGKTPVEVLDLRNTVTRRAGKNLDVQTERRDPDRFVLFDLGQESLLEAISTPGGRFRNTGYNPDRLAEVQRPGVHRFLLCKEPFEADVVLNLPKLKAHAKAGITAALKNLVGVNGDKDYLPHHRIGGSRLGGDCYEGLKLFKRFAELLLDSANRRIGRACYPYLTGAARLANTLHGGDLEGKWAGNDTTWRMVLDLNRILLYGDATGSLSSEPRRRIFSLTDGVIIGEGNGPLAPLPRPAGFITFASNSAAADAVHVALMRFDHQKLALVREAFSRMRFPIASFPLAAVKVASGEQLYNTSEAWEALGVTCRPPDGWKRELAR